MSHFSIRFSPTDERGLIISVSKKVSKKAVIRNRVKRRVRAVMRDLLPQLKAGKYLIVAKPSSQDVKGEELKKELRLLFVSYILSTPSSGGVNKLS